MTKRKTKERKLIPIQQAIFATLAFGLLAASVMMFFLETKITSPFMERPFNFYRMLVMAGAIVFLLLATKASWLKKTDTEQASGRATKYLSRIGITLPVLAIIFTLLQLVVPEFATILVRKEDWPFFRNAIFIKMALQIIGLVFFAMTARRYFKQRNWLGGILSVLICLVLFVMAGEELSWGQRIFGWATPEAISKVNAQNETNLHNMATQAFQNTLYFGGWLLLIGFSFWRKTLSGIINKVKPLAFLANWLPPMSFVLIFAVGFGFCDPLSSETGLAYGSNLFIVIATLIVLVAMCVKYVKERNNPMVNRVITVTAIFLFVLISNLFFSRVHSINSGAATEYLEMYISFGLMSWAYVVNSRVANQSKLAIETAKEPTKSKKVHHAI